jgi:hypothetical protein
MPISIVQNQILAMSEVAVMMLGMLVLGLILTGGWWLTNWRARHPRPIIAGNASGSPSALAGNAGSEADLPVLFRMSTTTQFILYVLLLSPPVVATILIRYEWEGLGIFLMELLFSLLNPAILFLTGIIYLLCPFTAWNIYWRRRDFIRVGPEQIKYRSGFTSGKLAPSKIVLFRGRSWRFDLIDLFRGQMASSWFLEIIPVTGNGKYGGTEQGEHVVLDLKAMNLGGSARSIAKLASRVYGDKFLVNNELPAPAG